MARLVASTFSGKSSLWLYLDNYLVLENSGNLALEIHDGTGFIVHWFVSGTPGDQYTITISSPREAEFQLTRGLNSSGKDHGGFYFKN